MSTAPKQLLRPQEYLAKERAAEFKSQYYRGEMFAMAGSSKEHTFIKVMRPSPFGFPSRIFTMASSFLRPN